MISGTTSVVGLIGFPATYSLSPALHNAAYKDSGIDAAYVVFPTSPEKLTAALQGLQALSVRGVSVTIPHKEVVIQACDELTEVAERLQAVNCIKFDGDKIVGHNTDGQGFILSLQHQAKFKATGKKCVVVGAGGVARAVVYALRQAGASDIAIINRSPENARATAKLGGEAGRVGDESDFANADLIVNSTPLGMTGAYENEVPVAEHLVHERQVVIDLIYKPEETELLRNARKNGAKTVNGLGMLVYQAAIQIEWWFGRTPNVEVMKKAVHL